MRARLSFVLSLYLSVISAVCAVPLSTVSGPTNVTVSCHNRENVLYWNYSKTDRPEFSVKIIIYGNEKPTTVHTNETFLDITEYTDSAEDSYFVTVAAVSEGLEHNDSSSRISFSYNEDYAVDFTCVVDFPGLNVSVLQRKVKLSFKHPYFVHDDESFNDNFMYTISSNGTEKACVCVVDEDEEECTEELHLYESLNGRCINMSIEGFVNSIPMKTSRQVCGDGAVVPTDWVLHLTIVICSAVGLLLLMLLVFLVYKKFTQPDSESTIFAKLLKIVSSEHIVNEPEEPTLSKLTTVVLDALPNSSDKTPLDPSLTPLEEMALFSSCPPTHLSNHFNDDVNLSEEQDEGQMMDDADSVGFDSFSGYDSCKFPIDMGQGDIVDAYGPR